MINKIRTTTRVNVRTVTCVRVAARWKHWVTSCHVFVAVDVGFVCVCVSACVCVCVCVYSVTLCLCTVWHCDVQCLWHFKRNNYIWHHDEQVHMTPCDVQEYYTMVYRYMALWCTGTYDTLLCTALYERRHMASTQHGWHLSVYSQEDRTGVLYWHGKLVYNIYHRRSASPDEVNKGSITREH